MGVSSPKQDWKLWYDKYVAEGAKVFDLEKKVGQLQVRNKRYKTALERVAEVALGLAVTIAEQALKGGVKNGHN